MPRERDLLGPARVGLQPKLQMIANGSSEVNAARAEQCAGLTVATRTLLDRVRPRRQEGDAPARLVELKKRLPARGHVARIPHDIEANIFVHLKEGVREDRPLSGELFRRGDVVRARVRLSELPELATDPRVVYVEIGEALKPPRPRMSLVAVSGPNASSRRFHRESQHRFGEDVLIGLIDVEGFDFSHPDFLDPNGKTRFLAIWDQGGDARPRPSAPHLAYGAEFTADHLNAALVAAPTLGVPAYEIERQSQMVEGSHGTHVASIAAGNRGVCHRSPVAGVLISLPEADVDRRRSFYDSTRLADAVDYLVALAEREKKPVAINISLGTNGHAHDGSGAIGRWIDAVLSTPGRSVTVAAGNAGQEAEETPGDIGWMMGRIHTGGRVPAADLTADIEWVVVGNGVLDISENELELWFSPQDRFAISLRTPSGEWTEAVEPRQYIENRCLSDGSFISIYNELYHPSNGCNYAAIYLSPNLRSEPVVGVPAGPWVVRLYGRRIRDGRYDAWIERDDPRPLGRVGEREAWSFPSFFSPRSFVDSSTVSSLGCGHRVITVANLDASRNRINITSSQGPTRDGRAKPDIAAPGTDIIAAKGFSTNDEQWVAMTGTSMAAPYVTGVIGLMLAVEPNLTAAQIEGILRSTARPLPSASFSWVNDAGFGAIDPDACLEQTGSLKKPAKDRTDEARGR